LFHLGLTKAARFVSESQSAFTRCSWPPIGEEGELADLPRETPTGLFFMKPFRQFLFKLFAWNQIFDARNMIISEFY
jgi:hypothetical protein